MMKVVFDESGLLMKVDFVESGFDELALYLWVGFFFLRKMLNVREKSVQGYCTREGT